MVLKPSSDSEHNREALHFRLQHKRRTRCEGHEAQTGAKSGTSGSAETVLVGPKGQAHPCSIYFPMFKRKMATWLGQNS